MARAAGPVGSQRPSAPGCAPPAPCRAWQPGFAPRRALPRDLTSPAAGASASWEPCSSCSFCSCSFSFFFLSFLSLSFFSSFFLSLSFSSFLSFLSFFFPKPISFANFSKPWEREGDRRRRTRRRRHEGQACARYSQCAVLNCNAPTLDGQVMGWGGGVAAPAGGSGGCGGTRGKPKLSRTLSVGQKTVLPVTSRPSCAISALHVVISTSSSACAASAAAAKAGAGAGAGGARGRTLAAVPDARVATGARAAGGNASPASTDAKGGVFVSCLRPHTRANAPHPRPATEPAASLWGDTDL